MSFLLTRFSLSEEGKEDKQNMKDRKDKDHGQKLLKGTRERIRTRKGMAGMGEEGGKRKCTRGKVKHDRERNQEGKGAELV